ncbi:hypothetical protein PR202_ga10596 [Eleusine coracana subsp. coracana]|uniref:Leucine-rich repeat-containing N-terminal plant-type domain-containing protein n=1 Tax=Eleusine coracana subsp. coracana TaxID=191504 RepID=A0AAV5C754_ELECO|nr:hypothetical protein PR202_ga10596 [Eleusine coracana subsp. coracana]
MLVARTTEGMRYVASEREALLSFRESLWDPVGFLSSWRGKDYCQWEGVLCSNRTGHVVKLDLGGYDMIMLKSEMSPSIGTLHHLSNIKELYLSCGWFGSIPDALVNMSALKVMYLNNNYLYGVSVTLANFENLCNLRVFDLSLNNIDDDIMRRLRSNRKNSPPVVVPPRHEHRYEWPPSSSHRPPTGCCTQELRARTRRDRIRPRGISLPHARTRRRPLVDVARMPSPLAEARLRARSADMRDTTEAPLDGAARDLARTRALTRGTAMVPAAQGYARACLTAVVLRCSEGRESLAAGCQSRGRGVRKESGGAAERVRER